MTTENAETLTSWTLPAAAQEDYRAKDTDAQEMLLRLGALEADYLTAKNAVMRELETRVQARMAVVTGAAKAAGLDVENQKWSLDLKTMSLKRG